MGIEHDLDCIKLGLAYTRRPGTLGAGREFVFCGRCEVYSIAEYADYLRCTMTHETTGSTGFNIIFIELDGTRHEIVWYRAGDWMFAPCDCGRKLFEPKGGSK